MEKRPAPAQLPRELRSIIPCPTIGEEIDVPAYTSYNCTRKAPRLSPKGIGRNRPKEAGTMKQARFSTAAVLLGGVALLLAARDTSAGAPAAARNEPRKTDGSERQALTSEQLQDFAECAEVLGLDLCEHCPKRLFTLLKDLTSMGTSEEEAKALAEQAQVLAVAFRVACKGRCERILRHARNAGTDPLWRLGLDCQALGRNFHLGGIKLDADIMEGVMEKCKLASRLPGVQKEIAAIRREIDATLKQLDALKGK